jgi:hypothetical protein
VYAVDATANTAWLCVLSITTGGEQFRIPMSPVQAQSGWIAVGTFGAHGPAALFAGTDKGIIAFSADTSEVGLCFHLFVC